MATLGSMSASPFCVAAPNIPARVTIATYANLLRPPWPANAQMLTSTKETKRHRGAADASSHVQHQRTHGIPPHPAEVFAVARARVDVFHSLRCATISGTFNAICTRRSTCSAQGATTEKLDKTLALTPARATYNKFTLRSGPNE